MTAIHLDRHKAAGLQDPVDVAKELGPARRKRYADPPPVASAPLAAHPEVHPSDAVDADRFQEQFRVVVKPGDAQDRVDPRERQHTRIRHPSAKADHAEGEYGHAEAAMRHAHIQLSGFATTVPRLPPWPEGREEDDEGELLAGGGAE